MGNNGVNGTNGTLLPLTDDPVSLLGKCRESGEYGASFSPKRDGYINWDEMHMGLALLSSLRSKDPCTQVGAVIVDDDNVILSIGYNGMPKGCDDDKMPWGKDPSLPFLDKHSYVCHAEENAILNTHKVQLKGAHIYTTMFPCNKCAKMIAQVGIKEIVYLKAKEESQESMAAKVICEFAKITVRKFQSTKQSVTLQFH